MMSVFPGTGAPRSAGRPIEIALINNGSRLSFEGVVAQFQSLFGRAAGSRPFRLHVASFPSVSRGRGDAMDVDTVELLLASHHIDAAIVTGAEPTCDNLEDEPYWGELTDFLDWADCNTIPLMLSCLAAHAAVQHETGLRRRRLPQKCFGVFSQDVVSAHELVRGVPDRFEMPHSRWNDIPPAALADAGYTLLSCSADAGADVFAGGREVMNLFFQGHPEYRADTLLREYRRDVGRFLRREAPYPALPVGVASAETASRLNDFRERACAAPDEISMADFPTLEITGRGSARWAPIARTIVGNWLELIDQRRSPELEAFSVPAAAAEERSSWST